MENANSGLSLRVVVTYTHDYRYFTKKYEAVEYFPIPKEMKKSHFENTGELLDYPFARSKIPNFPRDGHEVEARIISATLVDTSESNLIARLQE